MEHETISTIKCLIVDDEPKGHQALVSLIDSISWLENLGSCYSVLDAIDAINRLHPDVVFLDVEMPGLSGLDLLRSLQSPKPSVIMTTAFSKYALDGFENEVVDFLLKPIEPHRFLRSVLKVRGRPSPMDMPILMEAGDTSRSQSGEGSIWVRSSGKDVKIYLRDIFAVEGLKDYVKILAGNCMFVTHGTIREMAARLPVQFIRIHKSHIINRHAIREISGNMVILENGKEYRFSARKSRESIVKQLMQQV